MGATASSGASECSCEKGSWSPPWTIEEIAMDEEPDTVHYGSSSSASRARRLYRKQKSTSSDGRFSGVLQEVVTAEEVEREELEKRLREYAEEKGGEEYLRTLLSCVDLIAGGVGGTILMVVHETLLEDNLKLEPLDGGLMWEVIQSLCPSVIQDFETFKKLLSALTLHSASDRWEHGDLCVLVDGLEAAAEHVGKLEGQPKDGAVLISHKGVVRGAALHIKYTSKKLVMQKADGTSAGTRHAAALSMAEWLGTVNVECPGVILTRSDGGGAHAFIPRAGQAPRVLHFSTVHHLSQEEMLGLFKERIKTHGKLMLKKAPALIRRGVRGEEVLTVVGGRVTSTTRIDNDSSYVVQASTPDQEQYVLSEAKFKSNYLPEGIDLEEECPELLMLSDRCARSPFKFLKSKGFKLHRPRPNTIRCVYQVKAEDLEIMGIGSFKSSWGAIQPVCLDDYLACPAPLESATEIYLMPQEVIGAYVEVEGGSSVHSVHSEGREGPKILGQAEMVRMFGEKIVKEGNPMTKTALAVARPGVKDEVIVTCVHGRVLGCAKVADDRDKVVQGTNREVYVVEHNEFSRLYEPEGHPLPGKTPEDKLLSAQGFKLFKPKQTSCSVYKVKADDVARAPFPFQTSQGMQALHVGDHLALLVSQDTEIRVLTESDLESYSLSRASSLNSIASRLLTLASN